MLGVGGLNTVSVLVIVFVPDELVAVSVMVLAPALLHLTVGLIAVEVVGLAPEPKFQLNDVPPTDVLDI